MIETYRPSGGFGVSTLAYAVIALLFMAGFAFIYQLGLKWIPLIYISFLLTIAFGFGGGILGAMTVSRGHCRNALIAALVALLIAGGGIAIKHGFQYLDARGEVIEIVQNMQQQGEVEEGEVAFSFVDYVGLRVEQGWNIGRFGRNGAPVAGYMVWLIWALEAGIVLYITWTATMTGAKSPYNELKSDWADEAEVIGVVPVTDGVSQQIADANSIDQLLQPPAPTEAETNTFLQYTMNSIRGEENEDAYLSVDKVVVKVNNKGETSKDEKSLWKYAIVKPAQRTQVTQSLLSFAPSLEVEEDGATVAS